MVACISPDNKHGTQLFEWQETVTSQVDFVRHLLAAPLFTLSNLWNIYIFLLEELLSAQFVASLVKSCLTSDIVCFYFLSITPLTLYFNKLSKYYSWQVCEVFNFHRESYYLATDYIDRYLASTEDVPKQQLQLIGELEQFDHLSTLIVWPEYESTFRS